jgi:hypothetical protein
MHAWLWLKEKITLNGMGACLDCHVYVCNEAYTCSEMVHMRVCNACNVGVSVTHMNKVCACVIINQPMELPTCTYCSTRDTQQPKKLFGWWKLFSKYYHHAHCSSQASSFAAAVYAFLFQICAVLYRAGAAAGCHSKPHPS